MKINLDKIETSSSADFKSADFDIGNKAVIMDILRGRMYSSPIMIICQEIMCNARDAHREVGKRDVPIEVRLPSELEPEIEFRDYGPGITPERMAEIFVMYGNSTKRSSNEQTGGYGLGSKTPFSYTDTYTVISRTPENGKMIRREYVAYIDDSRLGVMSLVKEEESSEAQGTSVVVTIKPQDSREFRDEFIRTGKYWDVKPKCVNDDIEWPNPKRICSGSRWFLANNDINDDMHPVAIIDGIPYRINLHRVPEYQHFRNVSLRLLFETGEINITANREDIDYRPDTIEVLNQAFAAALDEVSLEIEKEISAAPSLRKAIAIYDNLPLQLPQGFKWNGLSLKKASRGISLTTELKNSAMISSYYKHDGEIRRHNPSYFNWKNWISIRENSAFADRLSKLPILPRVKKIFDDRPGLDKIYVFSHRKKDDSYPSLELLKLDYWDHLDVIDLDAIKVPTNGKSTAGGSGHSSPPARMKLWGCDTWEKVDDPDLDNGCGHYVVLSGRNAVIGDIELSKDLIRHAGHFYGGIYGVFARFENKLGKNWKKLTSLADIRTDIENYIASNPDFQYEEVSTGLMRDVAQPILKVLKAAGITDDIVKYFELVHATPKMRDDIQNAYRLYKLVGGKRLSVRTINMERTILKRFPLLRPLRWDRYRSLPNGFAADMAEYIIYKIRKEESDEVCKPHPNAELTDRDVRQGVAEDSQKEPESVR